MSNKPTTTNKYKSVRELVRLQGGRSVVYTIYKHVLGLFWWPTADYFFDEKTANNYVNKKNGF